MRGNKILKEKRVETFVVGRNCTFSLTFTVCCQVRKLNLMPLSSGCGWSPEGPLSLNYSLSVGIYEFRIWMRDELVGTRGSESTAVWRERGEERIAAWESVAAR